MSYMRQALLADDGLLRRRVIACAALEGMSEPEPWSYQVRWQLSAQPGWVEAYSYAIDSGDPDPGANEGAITDGMILSAVQLLNQPEEIG